MELAPARVGPYLRALQAGLHALAPNADHVPLQRALDHLQALDPAVSGQLLGPAEADERSGMPSFLWMERAISEQALARDADGEMDDQELARAGRLNPELGQRLAWRRSLHRFLRVRQVLAASELSAALKRQGQRTTFAIALDRISPVGSWMRLGLDVSGPAGWEASAPLVLDELGRVRAAASLKHLLMRHSLTPLCALHAQLEDALDARVERLARSLAGPFWFPGLPLPADVPDELGNGLLLHLSSQVLSQDITGSVHRDPWLPPVIGERLPQGYGLYRERRFAASPALLEACRFWGGDFESLVVPLSP